MIRKQLTESIKVFKQTNKLKKSKVEMDIRSLINTYNTIYYLYNNDIVTYIGQSLSVNDFTINRRIIEHYKNGKKFDKYVIRKVDLEYDINIIESFEIVKHRPIENNSISAKGDELRSVIRDINGHISREDDRYITEMCMKRSGKNNDDMVDLMFSDVDKQIVKGT